jgi:hypothetical protein
MPFAPSSRTKQIHAAVEYPCENPNHGTTVIAMANVNTNMSVVPQLIEGDSDDSIEAAPLAGAVSKELTACTAGVMFGSAHRKISTG